MIFFYPKIVQKSIEWYLKFCQISCFYNSIYFNSFLDAIKEVNSQNIAKEKQLQNENENDNILLKKWFKNMYKEFDEKLKSNNFTNLLDIYANTSLDLLNDAYSNRYINPQLIYHDFFDFYLKYVYSPLISYSKEINLSNHEIVFQKDNIKILHYINNNTNNQQTKKFENNNALLVIYAPINRFHILDLNPSKSVVRTLLNNGIDVYLLDWGYPDKRDNDLTLKDYINYIDDAVQAIIQSRSAKSSSQLRSLKMSILGYCWGGLFSLIYTSTNPLYQKYINKLILMATPIDFSKDNTTVSLWSKSTNTDKIADTFGHFDGYFLDYVFNMRNPAKFIFGKYLNFWKHSGSKEFVNTFFDMEKWLHDTPPIPGKLYKKIVNDCYKNNLLITGNMNLEENQQITKVGNEYSNNDNNLINLNRIDIPVLSITAEKDDLVSSMSSIVINDYISSKEKEVFKHPGGHVSLCISDQAHTELWPKVANWIKS